MTITQDPHMEALYTARHERFDAILEAYNCGVGSFMAPPASPPDRDAPARTCPAESVCSEGRSDRLPKIGRWAVVTCNAHGDGHFVTNVAVESALPHVAAAKLEEGWVPLCYYDLDNLAGDEPLPAEGDQVSVGDGTLTVTETEHKDGMPTVGLSDGTWQFAGDIEVVERVGSEDRRLPLRYEVAKVITVVVFNTRPDFPPA
jgi:hypothetical protein